MVLTLNTAPQTQPGQYGSHVCHHCQGYGIIITGTGLCDSGFYICRHCPAGERERIAAASKTDAAKSR